MREASPDPCGRLVHKVCGDVDRNIETRHPERIDQNLGLEARTSAILQQDRLLAAEVRDFSGMLLKNGRFRARKIIFLKLRDRFEELAASIVVKPATWQRFLAPRKTCDDVSPERGELLDS